MTQDEAATAKLVRRYLERKPIDSSMAIITMHKRRCTISGTIRPLRSQPTVDVKEEVEQFKAMLMRQLREVNELFVEARIILPQKKEKAHEGEAPTMSVPGESKLEPIVEQSNTHHRPGMHH